MKRSTQIHKPNVQGLGGSETAIGRMEADRIPSKPMASGQPLYKTVFDLLEEKIRTGDLCEGASLKEGSIVAVLGVSRAPVRRALEMLCDQGSIRPANGQGYVIGCSSAKLVRLNARQLGAVLSEVQVSEVERSTAWKRIYDDIRREVTSCLPFGTYQISETKVGRQYSVSRTVVREVLDRLMDRGLIEKDRKSHWIAGPLTARDIHETSELRQLLEPRALAMVAPHVDRAMLQDMRARVITVQDNFDDASPEDIEALEDDMHRRLFAGLKNRRMLEIVGQNQLSFIVPELFRRHFGSIRDRTIVKEHGLILDRLLDGATDKACEILASHLKRSKKNTLAKLRVLSILPKPPTAQYLVHVH